MASSDIATGFRIEGLEDCLKWLDACPENCLKITRSALRDAAKATNRQLKAKMPSRFRHLAKYKVSKLRNGKLNAGLGLFNGHEQQGHQMSNGMTVDDWFKAYWKNYGTLSKRDPNHRFVKPVRRNVKRRNNVGQAPQLFFEAAIAGYDKQFMSAFEDSLKKNEQKFYDR